MLIINLIFLLKKACPLLIILVDFLGVDIGFHNEEAVTYSKIPLNSIYWIIQQVKVHAKNFS